MLKQQIDHDLKTALLAGDKTLATLLRGLKSAVLYVEVAKGVRDEGLPDEEILSVLGREAKKRQESADLYQKVGDDSRAQAELYEKKIIEAYLPKQLSAGELSVLVDQVIQELQVSSLQGLGQVIAAVKQKAGPAADGARVAQIVKERLA